MVAIEHDRTGFFTITLDGRTLARHVDAVCETSAGRLAMSELWAKDEPGQRLEFDAGSSVAIEARTESGVALTWTIGSVEQLRGGWTLRSQLRVANEDNPSLQVLRLVPLTGVVPEVSADNELRCLDTGAGSWGAKSLEVFGEQAEAALVSAVAGADHTGLVAGFTSVHRHRGFITWTRDARSGGIGFECRHETIGAYSAASALGARPDPPADRSSLVPSEAITVASNPYPGLLERTEALDSETVVVTFGDVLLGLEEWAGEVGATHGAVTMSPPAAGFYTWYYYREQVDEEVVLSNARYLAEHRDILPVNYVHLDWGWQANYSCGDRSVGTGFPNGLAWLADQVASLGFYPGIWLAAFMHDYPSSRLVVERPDLFQKDIDGEPMSFGEPIRNFMARVIPGMKTYLKGSQFRIDPTAPEAADYVRERYGWARDNGFREIMLDFTLNGVPAPQVSPTDAKRTWVEAMRTAMHALRDAVGDETMIMGCGTPYEPMIGFGNFVRVAVDIPANWHAVARGCRPLLWQYFMHNRLWTNYADAVSVRAEPSPFWPEDDEHRSLFLTTDEARFYVAVTGLTAAAVMIAEDLLTLPPDRVRLLSLILPICDEGEFRPVDLFATESPRLLRREFIDRRDPWAVAAILNWEDESDEHGATVGDLLAGSSLAGESHTRFHIFDPFEDRYLGIFDAERSLGPVPPHGACLLRITPVYPHPQVVGTTTHISQGAAETVECVWDSASQVLTSRLADLHGRTGEIIVAVPAGWRWLRSESEQGQIEPGSDVRDSDPEYRIVRVPVVLDADREVVLQFERG